MIEVFIRNTEHAHEFGAPLALKGELGSIGSNAFLATSLIKISMQND